MIKYCLFIFLILSSTIYSAEKDGIFFADKINDDGKDLILNGIGIRKATIFKVKVYYGGLYLEQKSTDPLSFINSSSRKQLVMNFVREVDAKKLRNGFNEGLMAANQNYQKFNAEMEKFNSCIEDVVKGDKIIIIFSQNGIILNVKGKIKDKIIGSEFSQAILRIWFINPADPSLRDGLLAL